MNQPLNPLQVDVSNGEIVAFVSTDRPGVRHWTELAIHFIPSADGRCFLAESKGCSRVKGQNTRRRAVYVGTIERAFSFFDESDLSAALEIQAQDWHERNFHKIEAGIADLRDRERLDGEHARIGGEPWRARNFDPLAGLTDPPPGPKRIGYPGQTLLGAVDWLYGEQDGKPARLAEDFGVPRRTVQHALDQEKTGQALSGWARAFVAALRWFDHEAFGVNKAIMTGLKSEGIE